MSRTVLISVVIGLGAGYLFAPDAVVDCLGTVITVVLCLLLFFVGVDLGRQGKLKNDIKRTGFGVLIVPLAVVLGTLFGGAAAALVLPLTVKDGLAVSAGFAWYSLAPAIIMDYSPTVSAVSFLHNVFREVIGLVLIPVVAKKIGFMECISLPGAAAMDVCLPIVERATNSTIAVYSFVTGVILSILVPILTSFFITL